METPLFKWYLLSGIVCGLAAGTKYPAGLSIIMPLLALSYSIFQDYQKTKLIPNISKIIVCIVFIIFLSKGNHIENIMYEM